MLHLPMNLDYRFTLGHGSFPGGPPATLDQQWRVLLLLDSSAMPDASFPSTAHLRTGRDFERVYALKCKGADGVLLLFVARNDLTITRIGLSVSKKHGGAVQRNQLKRWLREAFRLERRQFPTGLDLIAIPLAYDRASLSAYRQSLAGLVKRLSRRLNQAAPSTDASP